MTKAEAREKMRQLRRALSDEERTKKERRLVTQLLSLDCIKQADTVFSYAPYGTEASPLGALRLLSEREGKKIAFPRVEGDNMHFYAVGGIEELIPGFRGIPEPPGSQEIYPQKGTVMLMPGLAFDRYGGRAGYGGGYYDRYLERFQDVPYSKAAVAYDFQLVERIETEYFDRRPDYIVTDKRTIVIRK